MSGAVVELECWAEDRDGDYARVFTDLEEDEADDLYEHLCEAARQWVDERAIESEQLRRTTGRPVQLAQVLDHYVDEGLLAAVEVDGQVVFRPHHAVQAQWDRPRSPSALVTVRDE